MSFQEYRPGGFAILPPVVKNLLIINVLCFLGNITFGQVLNDKLGLHYFLAEEFSPFQFVSYMFMHGGFTHLLFNMFALWMFGNALENYWGGKRFLTYYMITGIGAGVLQMLVVHFRLMSVEPLISAEALEFAIVHGFDLIQGGSGPVEFVQDPNFVDAVILIHTTTVGASGAVFGLLLAFGMLFPNSMIYLYFAIPIKAKYFVILYGVLELYSGIQNNAGDNVAHFAHLGGMLFGFFLIKYWKRNPGKF